MKREIKFRGLRIDGKGWVYGYLVDWRSVGGDVEIMDLCHAYEVIPESVGQFTGLKDKNGNDIYEGDLLKYYQPYSKKWENNIVLWDEKFSCFGLFENNNEWCKESDWLKIEQLEIIGNIHEQK